MIIQIWVVTLIPLLGDIASLLFVLLPSPMTKKSSSSPSPIKRTAPIDFFPGPFLPTHADDIEKEMVMEEWVEFWMRPTLKWMWCGWHTSWAFWAAAVRTREWPTSDCCDGSAVTPVSRSRRSKRRADILGVFIMVFAMWLTCCLSIACNMQFPAKHSGDSVSGRGLKRNVANWNWETVEITSTWELVLMSSRFAYTIKGISTRFPTYLDGISTLHISK